MPPAIRRHGAREPRGWSLESETQKSSKTVGAPPRRGNADLCDVQHVSGIGHRLSGGCHGADSERCPLSAMAVPDLPSCAHRVRAPRHPTVRAREARLPGIGPGPRPCGSRAQGSCGARRRRWAASPPRRGSEQQAAAAGDAVAHADPQTSLRHHPQARRALPCVTEERPRDVSPQTERLDREGDRKTESTGNRRQDGHEGVSLAALTARLSWSRMSPPRALERTGVPLDDLVRRPSSPHLVKCGARKAMAVSRRRIRRRRPAATAALDPPPGRGR